eukprot:COSAG03_NODE_9410_length_722_cov_0.996790_1_plen_186_part_10
MKRMLDEKAITVLEDLGYDTDWRVWNLKMVLGTISCICAGVAQLWPGEYPETKVVLMACCGIYYACAVWLQYIASFVECGWFVFTRANSEASWSKTAGIALTSYMERYDYEYTLCVEVRSGAGGEACKGPERLFRQRRLSRTRDLRARHRATCEALRGHDGKGAGCQRRGRRPQEGGENRMRTAE